MKQEEIVDAKAYARYLAGAIKLVKAKGEEDDEGSVNFALSLGAKGPQSRLALAKADPGKGMAAHLVQWTKVKEFTYGAAFFEPEKKDTLVLDLEHPAPSGAKKKAQAMLKAFAAPRFTKVALFLNGEEVLDEDSEDDDDSREGDDELSSGGEDSEGDDSNEAGEDDVLLDPVQLKATGEKVKILLIKAIQAHPELRERLLAPFTAFTGQLGLGQLEAAKASLERAARQVQLVLSAPQPKLAPQVDENTPQQKQGFDTAFRRIGPLLHSANQINPVNPQMQDLKARMLKAEEGLKAAAGRTDYEAALKFVEPLRIAAQRLTQMNNSVLAGQREVARQRQNRQTMNQLVSGLDGSFDGIQPGLISTRNFDFEASVLFPKNRAQTFANEGRKPGGEFTALLNRLKEFENVKTPENADEIEKAADDYLRHLRGLNRFSRTTKESKRKKAIADQLKTEVAQYRQLMLAKAQQTDQQGELTLKNDFEASKIAVAQAGDPPWDPVKESELRGHHAKLVMLSARRLGGQDSAWRGANDSGATGDSPSFWIGTPRQDGKTAKKFFFKPLEAEDRKYGMPRGGMAAREIVSQTVANRLSEKTGIEFGLPTITPTVLPNRYLQHMGDGPAPNPDAPCYGSMQDFSDAPQGTLGSTENQNALVQGTLDIPKEEVQKVALLDMILLNTDRNANNLLLGGQQGLPPTLIPIDQGLCLPTRKVLKARGGNMSSLGNALLSLPGADEKLSDEMQEKLALIAPDDIAQSVQAGRGTLRTTGRQDADALLSDESVQLSSRALAFVKRAAPHLTVKQIFSALGNDQKLIFDSTEEQMEEAFTNAIAAAPGRVKAQEEINTPPQSPAAIVKELQALGWGYGLFGKKLEDRVQNEAESWLKIAKSRTVNPMLQSMIAQELTALGNPRGLIDEIGSLDIAAQQRRLNEELDRKIQEGLRLLPNRDEVEKKFESRSIENFLMVQKALGKRVPSEEKPDHEAIAKAFQDAGGDAVLDQLVASIPDWAKHEKPTQIKQMKFWPAYLQAGGDDAYYDVGGNDQIFNVSDRIQFIKERKDHDAAFRMLVDEKDLDERIKDRVMSDLESMAGRIQLVQNLLVRGNARGKLATIHELTDADQFEPAIPLLKDLDKDLKAAGV